MYQYMHHYQLNSVLPLTVVKPKCLYGLSVQLFQVKETIIQLAVTFLAESC